MKEGSEHSFTLSDVVIADKAGKNHATGFSAGKLAIIKLPDLDVSNVETSAAEIKPGDKITLNWQVRNIGGLSTTSGWNEQIFLDGPESLSKQLTKIYYDEPLAADGVISRSAEIVIPQLLGIEGDATLRVKLVPNSDSGEPTWLRDNNSASTSSAITVDKILVLSPQNVSVDEAEAKTVKFYLQRSGFTKDSTAFFIEATPDSRITFPTEVSIGKGQSGVYFYAQISANKTLDNDSVVHIKVTGNEYPAADAELKIYDDTFPLLTVAPQTQDVTEGGSIELKISTQRISSEDIPVTLACNESTRFTIPTSIVIPAGESAVTVVVEAKEDEVPDTEHVVTFTASAANHEPGEEIVILLDNDVPTLQMELTPTAVSEAVGLMGVNAILKRTDNIDKAVTVKFTDDSNGAVYYARQTVEMAAGVEEVTVNLGPIDNAVVDGERTYNISAAVYIASCDCNANNGVSNGVVTQPLTVYDNDGPALSMSSSSSILKEGGEIEVTVSRNTGTDAEQVVTLSCDSKAELEYPSSVTIPAGKESVTFTVKSTGNASTGDGFNASLMATADGFAKGSVWFTVSDQTLPDAQITEASLSVSEAEVNSEATFTFTLYNSGSYELPELTEVGIYLADASALLATAYLQAPLAAGNSIVMKKVIALPESVGEYKLYAMANDEHKVKELLYTNNASAMIAVKTLSPYSTTTVNVDKATYNKGEEVIISGTIEGTDVGNKTVEVYIINSGYRHVIQVETAEDGTFQTSYTPYEGQIGHFAVGACYPGEKLTTELTSFEVYGITRTSNAYLTNEILLNEATNGTFSISNPSKFDLTGVGVKVVSKPDNCDIQVDCPQTIGAEGTMDVSYTLLADSVSPGNDWEEIKLLVGSKEGASLPVTLYYYCRNKSGALKASIASIKTTMIKGATRDYPFTITNTGKGETGKISLALPSWITSATPTEMASLEADASTTVILRFSPTEDMQLNVPVMGAIGINCENGIGLSLPYNIEPVSETTGTLTIDVCDEYTYYTAEAPHVAGAEVIVSHPTTGAEVAKGTTGTDGKFSVEVPEGYYAVSVTASKHDSYRNNVLVDPGIEKTVTVNLSYEAITVDFKVEEIEIKDEYEITTTVKYETNVPMPVVELIVPSRIEAKALPEGESLIFHATLTNKGLITAQDVELLLPEGFTTLSFEALSHTEPFTLVPQQSIRIPVRVTKMASTVQDVRLKAKPIDNDPCRGQVGTLYYWDCGLDRKWHPYEVALQLGACDSNDPSTWDNSGNGNYGGGGYGWRPRPHNGFGGFSSSTNNVPGVKVEDDDCEPCQNKFMMAMAKCLVNHVPIFKDVWDIVGWVVNPVKSAKEKGKELVEDAVEKLIPVYGWVRKFFGYKEIYEDCIKPIFVPCDLEGSNARMKVLDITHKNRKEYPSYILEYQNEFKILIDASDAEIDIMTELFGFENWQQSDPNELYEFMIEFQRYTNGEVSKERLVELKPQAFSHKMLEDFLDRWDNTVNEKDEENRINFDNISNYVSKIDYAKEHVAKLGYTSLSEYYVEIENKLNERLREASNSVCSSITLQFSQQMVMTRQAFRGTLTVFNGSEDTAMENAKLTLEVKDENGKLATSHEFQINPESLTRFEGNLNLTDGWTLAAGETGVATILFIPTKYAAPMVESKYSFGGSLSYIDPYTGLEVTRTLSPVTLTVKPSPDLNLTYFMQRDIYGDDPLTEAVEASEEAEFSLLINNVGYGDATNVQMLTEQPKIIENEKGLMIDFELMSSQLNGGEKTLALGGSVATDFGNIPAKSQTYAQWWLKSSLLGHFTDYEVEATHVSSYGNPDLSLLNEVTIHELIRSLEVVKGDNTLAGFMVNDIVDANDTPDMLYLSDGEIEPVAVAANATIVRNSATEYVLTIAPSAEGWNYGNVIDPTYGVSKMQSVVRQSDGKSISLRNFWQTDRTLRDGKDPLYENRIHFADEFATATTETYLLTFEPIPQPVLQVASIEGIPAESEVAKTPVETIKVTFNKPIQPETFTSEDITLTVQGVKQDVENVSITTTDNKAFTLNLSEVNNACGNGYYVFTVQTAGITDHEGYPGKTGKSVGWNMYRDGEMQLATSVSPEAAGAISRSDNNSLDFGATIKLIATASNGYNFVNWTVNGEDVSAGPQMELAVTSDMDVVANFKKQSHSVVIESESEGGAIENSYTGRYEHGSELTLNAVPHEDFVFTSWIVNGVTIDNQPTLNVSVDKELNISALFTRVIYQQKTILEEGWNWISTYINEEMPVEEFTDNVVRLVGQFDELIYDPVYGLVGNLDAIKPGAGYKVETSRVSLKVHKGRLYDVEARPIALKTGWNWISYPYFEGHSRVVITNADEGDYIIAQDGFAEYANGSWEGTFGEFVPGAGYLYKSTSDKDLTFAFQNEASKTRRMNVPEQSAKEKTLVDIRKYPNTMNVVGKLYVDNQEVTNGTYRIYAMAGNEVRGVGREINGNYYLTIYGDEPVGISFIVEDESTGNTFIAKETLSFRSDVVGSRKAPFEINAGEATGIDALYGETRKMKVYTVFGILIHPEATVETLKELPRGVYIIDNKKYVVK